MQDLYHQQYFWHDCKVQEAGVRHTLEELPSRAQKKALTEFKALSIGANIPSPYL